VVEKKKEKKNQTWSRITSYSQGRTTQKPRSRHTVRYRGTATVVPASPSGRFKQRRRARDLDRQRLRNGDRPSLEKTPTR